MIRSQSLSITNSIFNTKQLMSRSWIWCITGLIHPQLQREGGWLPGMVVEQQAAKAWEEECPLDMEINQQAEWSSVKTYMEVYTGESIRFLPHGKRKNS